MASLPTGRALAPPARSCPARPRGPGLRRGLLRRPGRGALRDPRRGPAPGPGDARSGPARPGGPRRDARPACRDPARGADERPRPEPEPVDPIRQAVNEAYLAGLCVLPPKQDGSQGTKIAAKTTKHYDLYDHKEKTIPEGYYLDLTALLASHGFIRIKAQKGWESKAKKQEWWHFHYTEGLQETFLDEMELIGYTEAQIKQSGRTEADMDHPPG